MKRTIYTEEQREQMRTLYLSGISASAVADMMSTDKGTCRREIRDMGILRSKRESSRVAMGIKFVRSDAFDILTPDALYWIGFLYADGHIEKNAQVITVSLSEKDKDHLEKLNQFLGGYLNLRDITPKANRATQLKGQKTFGGGIWRLGVTDEKLYNSLRKLGFTNTKTTGIVPHELLKGSRDFWRGVIDGDGWLSVSHTTGDNKKEGAKMYSYPKVGLCGTKGTIEGFLEFIKGKGITCKSQVKKAPRENELYSMDAVGKSAIAILQLLYKDSVEYLDRKYRKYLEFITE